MVGEPRRETVEPPALGGGYGVAARHVAVRQVPLRVGLPRFAKHAHPTGSRPSSREAASFSDLRVTGIRSHGFRLLLDQASPSASYSRRKPSKSRRWPSSSWRISMTMSCVTQSTPSAASMIRL